MNNFSIELAAESINDQKSKIYFSEVLSSFINENYRSATVMLWSVVICDLVYKLQALRDTYNDKTATSLLEEIDQKQTSNPTSSEWESYLLDEIHKRTSLLEPADHQNLKHLHMHRHLSAHPVMSTAYTLFSPNKETTRAALRNALEATLLKPPIFSKKIVQEFIIDISAKKHLFPNTEDLKRYLDAKYFVSFHPAIEQEIQKSLWKLCFSLVNDETDTNRGINTKTLGLIYQRNPIEFKSRIQSNTTHYSNISHINGPLGALILFLRDRNIIYTALDNSARVIIENHSKQNIDLFSAAYFINKSMLNHITQISEHPNIEEISEDAWSNLIAAGKIQTIEQQIYEIGIKIYIKSGTYASADINFDKFIDDYSKGYDLVRINALLAGIETNNQTYDRRRAKSAHINVKNRANELGITDFSMYPNFCQSISS